MQLRWLCFGTTSNVYIYTILNQFYPNYACSSSLDDYVEELIPISGLEAT